MFRLLKLAAYALFGYAIYEFFRGMNDTAGAGGAAGGGRGSASRGMGGGGAMRGADRGVGQMTGPAEGRAEATQDTDGGSVRHRVGRGVIPSGM